MRLIGEASRLIAVEINLEGNSPRKQNYILLYRDESEVFLRARACCISNATAAACGQKPKKEFGNKLPVTLPVFKIPA